MGQYSITAYRRVNGVAMPITASDPRWKLANVEAGALVIRADKLSGPLVIFGPNEWLLCEWRDDEKREEVTDAG